MSNTVLPPGLCVVVVGAPGAGKTTLASALATRHRIPLIDKDTLAAPVLAGLATPGGPDPANLDHPANRRLSPLLYRACERVAAEQANLDLPVVLVAPYTNRATPGWLDPLAALLPRPPAVIWLEAPLPLVRERLTGRGTARDRHALASWHRFETLVELGPPHGEHLRLDASSPAGELLAATETYLAGR